MAIATPHATGVSSMIAFVFCVIVNCVHLYLSKTSKSRQTLFGKRLIRWSHLSMLFVNIAPLLMIFSYVHPEYLFSESSCLCREWYALAVISFVLGLYLLKVTYLVRLNMVLNPGRVKQCTPFLSTYSVILAIEMISVNTIQFIVIEGDCNVSGFYGCNASFASWNGWMACGILLHDMVLYYLFCIYFIRRVRGKLFRPPRARKKRNSANSRKLQMSKVGSEEATDPNSNYSASRPASATNNASKKSLPSESQAARPAISAVSGDSIVSNMQSEREKQMMARKKQKLQLVFNGLMRQFRITLLAIGVCGIDMFVNTVWMDYDMLWVFMLDCCCLVSFNFMAFRDARHLVMTCCENTANMGCDVCTILIDVCCCMTDVGSNNEPSTRRDQSGTARTDSPTISEGMDDSYLRYTYEKEEPK